MQEGKYFVLLLMAVSVRMVNIWILKKGKLQKTSLQVLGDSTCPTPTVTGNSKCFLDKLAAMKEQYADDLEVIKDTDSKAQLTGALNQAIIVVQKATNSEYPEKLQLAFEEGVRLLRYIRKQVCVFAKTLLG